MPGLMDTAVRALEVGANKVVVFTIYDGLIRAFGREKDVEVKAVMVTAFKECLEHMHKTKVVRLPPEKIQMATSAIGALLNSSAEMRSNFLEIAAEFESGEDEVDEEEIA